MYVCNKGAIMRKKPPEPWYIKNVRAVAGLTQTEAAALVHSTTNAWQKWEDGTRRMHPALLELFLIKTGKQDGQLTPEEWLRIYGERRPLTFRPTPSVIIN